MSENIIEEVKISLFVPSIRYKKTITLTILDNEDDRVISYAIFVIQGYQGDPKNGEEKAEDFRGIDEDGLGKLNILTSEDTKVYIYASSTSQNTKSKVINEIKKQKKINKNVKIVMVGHSMGADNIVELTKENRDVIFDLIILLDIKDASSYGVFSIDDDDINDNVKNVINYYQEGEKLGIGGEKVEIINSQKTKGTNILSPGSNHRSIDNDLKDYIIEDIRNFKNGKDVVKMANERKLPNFDPNDSKSKAIDISPHSSYNNIKNNHEEIFT